MELNEYILNFYLNKMKSKLSIILGVLILTSCKSIEKTPQKITYKNFYKFNIEIENDLKKDSLNPDYQYASTEYSLKGDQKNALRTLDLAFRQKVKTLSEKQKDSIENKINLLDAKDFILQKSIDEKIIMLNEAHQSSLHRVFAESLLQGLFDNGYKIFCVEALSNGKHKDTLLNSRKHPIQDTGFYTINPSFGNLLRTALKIGFKVLPYETTQQIGDEIREADQANNIKNIINEFPNEKIFIYCGVGHSIEGNLDYWGGKSLAGRITELTGINPLTIDQFFYSEKSKPEYNNPLLNFMNFETPSVPVDINGLPIPFKEDDGWIDIIVLHPKTNYVNNRPNWLVKSREHLVKIDLSKIKINYPIMVMAFKEGEDWIDGVPVDIQEVNIDDDVYLALDKGIYNIVISNLEGEHLRFTEKIS